MKLRFRLNHLFQGQNSPFLYAADAGLFAREGIDIAFSEGFSSSQVTGALIRCEADIGFGDVISVLEAALRSNDAKIACLMPIYVKSPCSLGYQNGNQPLRLENLGGAVLCGPKGDMSARLLPRLLARNGLADLRFEMMEVSPEERDHLVAGKKVSAATCFDATLKFSMQMRGLDSTRIEFLYFADLGLDIYSSALICARCVLDRYPGLKEALGGIVRTAWSDCRDDPNRGVRAVTSRNPSLDPSVVRAQLDWVLTNQVFPGNQEPMRFLKDSNRMERTLEVVEHGVSGQAEPSLQLRRLVRIICC